MDIRKEKLKIMLDSGKITSQQYEEMVQSLPEIETAPIQDTVLPHQDISQPLFRNTPWQVWFCVIYLLIVGVYDIYEKMFTPMIVCVVLAIGMLYRNRIAYVILGIIGFVTIFYSISLSGWVAALLDVLFVAVQWSIWKYYFNMKELDHKWSN